METILRAVVIHQEVVIPESDGSYDDSSGSEDYGDDSSGDSDSGDYYDEDSSGDDSYDTY